MRRSSAQGLLSALLCEMRLPPTPREESRWSPRAPALVLLEEELHPPREEESLSREEESLSREEESPSLSS